MKKLLPILFVFILTTLACVSTTPTATPTPVPPLPTEAATIIPPTATNLPTPIPPTPVPATEIPPTPISPTEVPPTAIPPTKIPVVPTTNPVEQGIFHQGIVSGTEVVFEDDFWEPKVNWQGNSGEEVQRSFSNGEFMMKVIPDGYEGWNEVPGAIYAHDVVLDVDVRGGVDFPMDATAGFVCGYVDNDNFYGMNVGADGWIEFLRYQNGERERLLELSDVVPLDPAGTHLTGVCTQNELSLYANWQLVASYSIDGLPAGSAGLLAGTYDTGNAEFYFDDFFVSKGPYMFVDGMTAVLGTRLDILWYDEFSDETTNWDVRTSDSGNLSAYVNGEYRMKVVDINYDLWSNPNDFVNESSNVIVEVNVRMGSNPGDAAAGIICNYDMSTNGDFTIAAIDGEGYAIIYERVGGEINSLFLSETPIKLKPDVNRLSAHCLGSSVTLLVNNQIVGTANTTVPSPGNVGLLTGTYENSNADFYYDNFVVFAAQ